MRPEVRTWRGLSVVIWIGSIAALTTAAGQANVHVFGNPDLWQSAPSRTYHVENYKLTLHLNESQGQVLGEEMITLRPLESHFRKFYLDSSELKIESVVLENLRSEPITLAYAVEDPRLWITLDRDYDSRSTLHVRIVYHGHPRTGLYFVNPTSNYPDSPQEVYSQGEPEFNHYWFPCWDYPNDMATSETITTVPEGQSVVSNGRLIKLTRAAGHVTYDWLESVPHSSYLISVAAGPWRKVTDRYTDKPVDYYVPNSVDEATARRSFHLTPDMIGFFSRATGVPYPYEQYAQTTVHNFPYGGQENVSATTLTDLTLHDERADLDYPSTPLVSHELGQHWFGNFVQGRDWANIWLNEGFATYLSALYTQHHENTDAYRFEIYQDQLAEQMQDREDYRRPIVDRHYTDPMQMFDEITHEKGAAVLDMLRYILDGKEATREPASQDTPFFQALHHYLIAHDAQDADTADLLEALRSTTGQELDWFFHEWVFMAGHPDYRVEARFDPSKRLERVVVVQMQQADAVTPIFDMPIDFAFYGANGEQKEIQVRDNLPRQEFDLPLEFEPQWIDFDPDDFIDKTLQFDKPLPSLIAAAEKDPAMMSRLWAVQQMGIGTRADASSRVEALSQVLARDRFYGVRAAAATSLAKCGTDEAKAALLSALRQQDSRVRTALVAALGSFVNDEKVYRAIVDTLHNDPSYAAQAAAAEELGRSRQPQAFEVLKNKVATKLELHVMRATLDGLAATGDSRAAEILLAHAQPGIPERIRLSALAGLAGLKSAVERDHAQHLRETVHAALQDPFFPLQEAGERLVGVFDLTEFQADIEKEAQGAPTAMQREAAEAVQKQLRLRK